MIAMQTRTKITNYFQLVNKLPILLVDFFLKNE
jgi:hypothetical protein